MRFKFETMRHGRCFAESEHDDDATRIAINHFQAIKTKDGDEYEMHCSRLTARWRGTLYNKLGG